EPNDPGEAAQHISYKELHKRVCKMANALKEQGIKKGDRVCIYLPMIPELAISMLACARIGAVHSVVFAGFSSSSVSVRINDAGCKLVITSDGGYRGDKTLDLKSIVDEALENSPGVETVLVVKRTTAEIPMKEGRDKWLAPLLEHSSSQHEPEIMDAEDPLYILYTSGSTGKPKGILHTTAGYMVQNRSASKHVLKYHMSAVQWGTADPGSITGHSNN